MLPRIAVALCLSLAMASIAAGQEKDRSAKPARFRDLLKTNQMVLLQTVSNNPFYTVQLLSDEQSGQIEQMNAERTGMEERRRRIDALLEEDHNLEELARLLQERHEIDTRNTRSLYTRTMAGTAYIVTHVGEDYVALKSGKSERFVPFSSIRYMLRRDTLMSTSRAASYRGRSSSSGRLYGTVRQIRLQNAQATEVAEVIKKLYSDTDLEITVDADGNTLELKSATAPQSSIQRLIEELDAHVKPASVR